MHINCFKCEHTNVILLNQAIDMSIDSTVLCKAQGRLSIEVRKMQIINIKFKQNK